MTRLHERIETALPPGPTFDFVADFANARLWDPGVVSSSRLDDGPLDVGARYRLEVRMGRRTAPMTYRVSVFDRPNRVVLVGSGSGVDAVDAIRFVPTDDGTRVEYTADIRLRGLLRLAQPLFRGTFARIADAAATGMRSALARRAAEAGWSADDVEPQS